MRDTVATKAPETCAVEDGGPAVFRRRLRKRKRTISALIFLAVVAAVAASMGQALIGPLLGGGPAVLILVPGLLSSLPYLARSVLRVGADRLTLQMGRTVLNVPWRDLTYVT